MLKTLFSYTRNEQQIDIATLVLRIFGGALMLGHGWPKLQKILNGDFGFADPIGLGPTLSLILTTAAEFGGALFLLLGLWTRFMSIPLMFTMLVAAFIVHGDDPFGKKEFPLLYFAVYLALFFLGSGRYSLDALRQKKG